MKGRGYGLIGGVLILLENQYAVGDSIQVGTVSGVVERITLRATYVRAIDGYLYVVPNGEVRIVANQTKEWSRALVDVGVAYEEDLDRALRVLTEAGEAFAQDPDIGPQLLEPPSPGAPQPGGLGHHGARNGQDPAGEALGGCPRTSEADSGCLRARGHHLALSAPGGVGAQSGV